MQFEAMRSFGARPWHYLYGNAVTALAFAGPLLTLIAFIAGAYACLVAFLMSEPEASVALFRRNFFATVWPDGTWLPRGTGWVILHAFLQTTGGFVDDWVDEGIRDSVRGQWISRTGRILE